MNHIRLKLLQHHAKLFPRIGRINRLKRIGQLYQLASAVKIHVRGIGLRAVPHAASRLIHTEILYLMPYIRQLLSQRQHIGFRTAVRL